MPESLITGKERKLNEVFSSQFEYHIPVYQRPYAWTVEQAGELIDDLADFHREHCEGAYFLGSIVLVKEESDPRSDVIDGQQRLTTLTILVAAIVHLLPGDDPDGFRRKMEEYVNEPGDPVEEIEPSPRLILRKQDQDFFGRYIQDFRFKDLMELDAGQLANESRANVLLNARLFVDKLKELFGDDVDGLKGFAKFLMNRCYLVSVTTPDRDSAYRVFSVMNDRGLDLLPTDIIKVDVIDSICAELRREYSDKWEELEAEAGRDGFGEVFAHTRMIFAKRKARKSLADEFREYVLATTSSPEKLIDGVIQPYTDANLRLTKSGYEASRCADTVNDALRWLNRLDNSDWMPVGMKFLAARSTEPDYVAVFFWKLERLAAYLHATSKNVNNRIARYARVLGEMEDRPTHSFADPLRTIELDEYEKREFMHELSGDIYSKPAKKRSYIMLRLDSFVSDGAATYDSNVLTVEHVLPQQVRADSVWADWWPSVEQRSEWVHKAANLVLLSRRKNSSAGNLDFADKKSKYFAGSGGTSSYALTTQVLELDVWTPDVLAARQEKLMAAFRSGWSL